MQPPDEDFHQVRHLVVSNEQSGQRIDNFLMSLLKTVPKSLVYRLLRTGQVRVNKGRIKAGFKLTAGDTVRIPPVTVSKSEHIHVPGRILKIIEKSIISDDSHWLVLNKPSGLAVHGGTGVKFGVIDALHQIFDDTAISLVHRLDRETSGCLVLARNRPAAVHFQSALKSGEVDKQYVAVLCGEMNEPVTVNAPLLKQQPELGDRMVVVDEEQGKTALTRFRPRLSGAGCSLVDIEIETGRTHQIRVHSAHLGHPVLGDERYGDRAINKSVRKSKPSDPTMERMFLHAAEISFPEMVPHAAEKSNQPVVASDTRIFKASVESIWHPFVEDFNRRAG